MAHVIALLTCAWRLEWGYLCILINLIFATPIIWRFHIVTVANGRANMRGFHAWPLITGHRRCYRWKI